MTTIRVIRGVLGLGLLLLIIGAPAVAPAGAQTAAKTATTNIVDFTYQPLKFEVDAGTTVTWANHGSRPHTVTDRGGTFDSNPIAPDGSYSVSSASPASTSTSAASIRRR